MEFSLELLTKNTYKLVCFFIIIIFFWYALCRLSNSNVLLSSCLHNFQALRSFHYKEEAKCKVQVVLT